MLEKIVDRTASKIKTDKRRDPCPEPGIVSIEAHDSTFNHDPTIDRSTGQDTLTRRVYMYMSIRVHL